MRFWFDFCDCCFGRFRSGGGGRFRPCHGGIEGLDFSDFFDAELTIRSAKEVGFCSSWICSVHSASPRLELD